MAVPPPRSAPFDLRSPPIMSSKEAPACVQKAMGMKERKPFTYTPGGLDLSEIKSEKMARRLMRNAMSPGVPETPKSPKIISNVSTVKPPVNYYNMPVAVFPMIQIPQNPKELLRRTSGPHRRDSFDIEVTSPKIQEKQSLVLENQIDDNTKNENVDEKNCDVKLDLKENIPIKENEIHVKKTIKVKKNKEKSGLRLKKKASGAAKIEKENSGTIIKIKEEKQISTIEYTICDKRSDVDKEQTELNIKDIIDINCKTNSFESGEEVQTECTITTQKKETLECPQIQIINKDVQYDALNIEKSASHNSVPDSNSEKPVIDTLIKPAELQVTDVNNDIKIEINNVLEENIEQQDEGDITPKIDIITHQFEPTLNLSPKVPEEYTQADITLSVHIPKSEECIMQEVTTPSNDYTFKSFRRENSSQIVSRRKSENIKSLNNDLDSVPSLNLCSKRFSFLRESPPKDDPFSILTGISAKLSLINNDKQKSISNEIPMTKNLSTPEKSDENIPKHDAYIFLNGMTPLLNESCKSHNNSFSQMNGNSTTSSISDEGEKGVNMWSSPKLFNDFSFNKIKDDLPAWKKELMEIANKKKEINEECEYYKEEVEPPWRRELRELAQSRLLKESAPSYNVWNKLTKAVELSTNEEPPLLSNPVWSQTLKPKTWKERKADLSREKEVDVPEWKNATMLRRNFMNSIINKSTSSSSSCSSPARDVRKTPEIMIEITGQPIPAQERATNNGYTNPWESSSESSTTFSPEPSYERTPTPQSRSSPLTQNSYSNHSGLQSPVVAREYGTLTYQPNKRHQIKSCPIQSRSFKYLQMLTGTSDGYDDDEPFIPQSPQHAHLRPDNV